MTQNDQDKFSELFTNSLIDADIKYASGIRGYAYVVYNEEGVLFSITFDKLKGKYIFDPTNSFKLKYEKYGLSTDAVPNPQMIYETVEFAYKIREIVIKAKKNISAIYNEILIDSHIIFQMRGNFETYMITNSGFAGFAIGHNKKTNQYGFKRYELVNTLYKICGISLENKPNYASLYKRAKDYYMAQVAIENIQHLYDL